MTEITCRACCFVSLVRELDASREAELSIVFAICTQTEWTGDRDSFLRAVSARLKAVDQQIVDVGGTLYAEIFH